MMNIDFMVMRLGGKARDGWDEDALVAFQKDEVRFIAEETAPEDGIYEDVDFG